VLAFFVLLSVLFSYRNSILIAVGSIIHILLVHVCKKWIFNGFPRPVEYLKDVTFHQIPGETLNHWQSFPSGHTTTAFMLATALIFCIPKKRGLHPILISLACLVGFSRIYLMQHFWVDVLAGALLGICSTLLSFYLLRNFLDQKKFQKGLLKKEVLPRQLQEFFFN
jgi:membrane-associated phospholipid phosphatase